MTTLVETMETRLAEELEDAALVYEMAAAASGRDGARGAVRALRQRERAARLRARAARVREILTAFEGRHTGDDAVLALTGPDLGPT